jgi:UDP-N-acetylmuramoyl-tripeptide--D-alanyl-D-alanine ligase
LTVLGLPNGWNNPLAWIKNIIDGFFTAFFSTTYPEVLVLEAGIDRKGDMKKLKRWLSPDIVVLTRLPKVPVHVEYFQNPEAVVEEKMVLVSAMKPEGVLVYNSDDSIIEAQLPNVLQKKTGFGRYLETDFTAREDRVVYADDMPKGIEFKVEHMKADHKVSIGNTIGTQHVYSCIAAIAVADELSVPIKSATEALTDLVTPPGRMRILPGIKSSLVIDDTYNSSPIAVEQALQAIKEVSYAKRKIAVLGDMLELGKFSADEHLRIGGLVADSVDVLFTVGVRAKAIAQGALAKGMSEKHIFQYEDVGRAGRELQNIIQNGDVILVKASQGIRAEKIIEEIMANPEEAEKLLVRQDTEWKNR